MKTPVSAVIITLNEEQSLPACLETLSFVDEIVVVDSGSTDTTCELAEKAGARVVHQDWLGYGKQKQFAVEQASHDWVLCLDADERISEPLRVAIEKEMEQPSKLAYQMPRCNRFMGRWLRHGEGYPDLSLRLFNRKRARWSEDPIHEKVETNVAVGLLKGDLLHKSEEGIEEYLQKQNRYTSLQAEALYKRGKKAGWLKLVFSPFLRFIKFFVLRLGFLDGLPGFVHICIGCFNSFMKYAKLRELNKADK